MGNPPLFQSTAAASGAPGLPGSGRAVRRAFNCHGDEARAAWGWRTRAGAGAGAGVCGGALPTSGPDGPLGEGKPAGRGAHVRRFSLALVKMVTVDAGYAEIHQSH